MKISKIGLIGILILVIAFSMIGGVREGAIGINASNIVNSYVNDITGLYNKNNIQNCTDAQAKSVLDDLMTNMNGLSISDKQSHPFLNQIVIQYASDKSINNVYSLLNLSIANYKTDNNYASLLKPLPVLIKGGGIPMATTPMATTPMATTPMATTPMATTPMATTPMATTPMATTPMATTTAPTSTSAPVYNTSYILKNDIDPLFSSTNTQLNLTDYALAYKTLQKMDQDIKKIPTPDPLLISIDKEIAHLMNGPNIYRDSTALLNKDIATLEPTASRPPIVLPPINQ